MIKKANLFHDIFLFPGEVCISNKPVRVITLLGSCVSITFFSATKRIGAILHALLPEFKGTQGVDEESRLKYLDQAFNYILRKLDRHGIDRDDLEIKLFGGSSILQFSPSEPESYDGIGRKNVEKARALIAYERMKIASEDTGGIYGRKLHFYPLTGDVYIKLIKNKEEEVRYSLPASGFPLHQ